MRRFLLCVTALAMLLALMAPLASAAGGYDPDGWTGSHTHSYKGSQLRVEPSCETDGYLATRCTGCSSIRVDKVLSALGHRFVWGSCTRCQAEDPDYIPGDITGDSVVNNEDVVQLLWCILFPEVYPLEAGLDLTGDGDLDNDDVVALLWHALFPEENPL